MTKAVRRYSINIPIKLLMQFKSDNNKNGELIWGRTDLLREIEFFAPENIKSYKIYLKKGKPLRTD